jgi:hypothetical protein
MRYVICILCAMLLSVSSARAQVSIGIGLPTVSIGINIPVYPALIRIPYYPVYYAPGVSANFFFYDGLYWIFWNDNWYASSWYNGPWTYVQPFSVPLFILRIPVRYYRAPPPYFRGWRPDAPPHWGQHWGPQWEQHRQGWDHWNRNAVPAPAPLPTYQRQYSGRRYPGLEQQPALRTERYRYQPHDAVGRQIYEQRPAQRGVVPSPQRPQTTPQGETPARPGAQRPYQPYPLQQRSPSTTPPANLYRHGVDAQRPVQTPSPGLQRGAPPLVPRAPSHQGQPQRGEQAPRPGPSGQHVAPQGQRGSRETQRGSEHNP